MNKLTNTSNTEEHVPISTTYQIDDKVCAKESQTQGKLQKKFNGLVQILKIDYSKSNVVKLSLSNAS